MANLGTGDTAHYQNYSKVFLTWNRVIVECGLDLIMTRLPRNKGVTEAPIPQSFSLHVNLLSMVRDDYVKVTHARCRCVNCTEK